MSNCSIKLGQNEINKYSLPYIIAEIGVNHEADFDTALRLVDLAKEGGADCAKFQTYKAETLAAKHSPAYWDTKKETTGSQRELFSKYDAFGPDEYHRLAEHCHSTGIDFCSTPFDLQAIEFLDPLVSFYKIASADITCIPLLEAVADRGKPVILSTGASNLEEIELAVSILEKSEVDIALLHCILNYPCPNPNANLNMILDLKTHFPNRIVGYSDHTTPDPDMSVPVAAWLKGAVIIEKHFTHDKTLPGNDHYHAMDVTDLKRLVSRLQSLEPVLGSGHKHAINDEAPAREHARRSIVVNRDIKKGHVISEEDLTFKRPAHGISPIHWHEVIGRSICADLKADHILQWEDLSQ